jgi:Subtilase family
MKLLRVGLWSIGWWAAGCTSEGPDLSADGKVPDEITGAFARGGRLQVLVRLEDPDLERELADLRAERPTDRAALLERRANGVRTLADALLLDLPTGARATRTYTYLPVVALELDDPGAAAVVAAKVAGMELDRPHEPSLTESLALIGQPDVELFGYTGAGVSVAVIDTGADWTVADLGSCTAAGVPSGTCRVAYAQDFAPEDNALDVGGHGTNVSAIVAGVAPEADVLALDVFSSDGLAWSSDILDALDWVVDNQSSYEIAAVNMSLGAGSYSAPCVDVFNAGIAAVRDAGVAVAVASGNNGYTSSISSPACNDEAVSVGATYDANLGGIGWSACTDLSTAVDQVTCFSNSASFLDILAPGALITAGGYTLGGTSMASPHVAGALAVVQAAFPDLTVDEVEAQVIGTGESIVDARNGLTFPRLDLFAALANEPAPPADTVAPSGTVTFAGGAVATKVTAVTLTLAATDDSGVVADVCLSSTTTCTAWQAYATSLPWTLSTGTGTKTVYATFRDAAGNTSARVSDTIALDTTLPTNGTVTATSADQALNLTWTGFSDTNGISSYTVVYGTTSPASCTAGTVAYTGVGTATTVSGLTNGTTYTVRVCATDTAGNLSAGATATQRAASELVPPSGTLVLNGGAAWTSNKVLTATLSATDASGVTEMCVGGSSTCTTWVPYATSTTYTTTTTSGTKTVWAAFKDAQGNVSASVSDTIGYDATKPVNGKINTTTVLDQSVQLAWSGFSDATSGLASYQIVYALTTAPTSCALGTVGYAGTATTGTVSGLTNGTLYGFRLCAVDNAGNVSSGITKTATPASELVAPTGTIVAENGAAYGTSRTMNVSLTGSDPSGIKEMCLYPNTAGCTTWLPFASTGVIVTSTDGTKTVNLLLKDNNGNENTVPFTDTIIIDTVKPVNGTVTTTAGVGQMTLTWSGFSDVTSGIASYVVVYGTTSPATCSDGTQGYAGTGTSTVLTGLTSGTSYTFRVCAVDKAGLVSSGKTATKTVL